MPKISSKRVGLYSNTWISLKVIVVNFANKVRNCQIGWEILDAIYEKCLF